MAGFKTKTIVEDQGCSHHWERTDGGYIRATSAWHCTVSYCPSRRETWWPHMTAPCPILLFPCTILANISICWYLVLVLFPHSLPQPEALLLIAVLL
jgi:hypothetical protein